MSFALLQTAMLLPAELLINQLLQLDPQSAARLQPFENRMVTVYCTAPACTLHVSIRQNQLHLSAITAVQADATLRGTAASLAGLLVRGGEVHNLHDTGITLTGSTGLISGLQTALRALDVDWEYQLSRLLGDLPAGAISRTVAASRSTVNRTRERFHEDLHDYLTLESGLLPSPTEVNTFYQALRQLILRTDRFQARMDLLGNSKD